MIFDKILTVFSNLFERMERIGIKSPIKNNFWLFKDFKSFEGFLEAHFASYALFSWTLKICDVRTFVTSVLYTCSRYEAFSDKMREHPVDVGSVVYSREKLRGVAGSRGRGVAGSRGRGIAGSIPGARPILRVLK